MLMFVLNSVVITSSTLERNVMMVTTLKMMGVTTVELSSVGPVFKVLARDSVVMVTENNTSSVMMVTQHPTMVVQSVKWIRIISVLEEHSQLRIRVLS